MNVVTDNLGAAGTDHEQDRDREVACFPDGACKQLLATMHDLVHAEFRAEGDGLHIVALLRGKRIIDKVLASLGGMGEKG